MFRAFADPIRLRILHLVAGGELCVWDLVEVLELPPTVSRHLSCLRRAALVSTRTEASWNDYSLASARGAFHQRLLACLGACCSDVPELGKDARRVQRVRARKRRCDA